jgi:hypothetical protein
MRASLIVEPDALIAAGDVDEREVPHLAIADLLEVVALARPRRRDANRRQQITGLQSTSAW